MWLGLADVWVFMAYALCLSSAALCVAYGLAHWNKGGQQLTQEDVTWAQEEDAISEEL